VSHEPGKGCFAVTPVDDGLTAVLSVVTATLLTTRTGGVHGGGDTGECQESQQIRRQTD
jgi:hypothetical protein